MHTFRAKFVSNLATVQECRPAATSSSFHPARNQTVANLATKWLRARQVNPHRAWAQRSPQPFGCGKLQASPAAGPLPAASFYPRRSAKKAVSIAEQARAGGLPPGIGLRSAWRRPGMLAPDGCSAT
jgi:hypothetical protein